MKIIVHMGFVTLLAGCMFVGTGCHTNRVHGVLPRTGELFMSTRASVEENNGVPIVYTGINYAPTIIVPVVCVPAGFVVGILDQFVCSPVWDVLCIPADLTIPTAKMKIVNTAGEPVRDSFAYCAGRHDANSDGVIQFKLMRMLGNPASVTINAADYPSCTYSVPRDNKEHTYVLLNREEFWKKLREDEAQREKQRREEMAWERVKRDGDVNSFAYWRLVLNGPHGRLAEAELHHDDVRSKEFKHVTFMLSRLRNQITTENLNYLFSLIERRPELAHEWSFLYVAPAVQMTRLEANRAFALKLAEDKRTTRPLLAVISRDDTPEEYRRGVIENPKLAYCRNEIENFIRRRQAMNEQQNETKPRSGQSAH